MLTRDDFTLDETGGFDDFAGPITDAYFEEMSGDYTAAMKEGGKAIGLTCLVNAPNFQRPVKLGSFSAGSADKWDISKGGKELVCLKGKAVFHSRANAGIFVRELLLLAGQGNMEKGQDEFIKRGYPMTKANFYIGLDSRWLRKQFPNPVDPAKTISVQVPTDYLKFGAGAPKPEEKTKGLEEAVADIIILSFGKDVTELKSAIVDNEKLRANSDLMVAVFNKGLLDELEKQGKLKKGADGKYVA